MPSELGVRLPDSRPSFAGTHGNPLIELPLQGSGTEEPGAGSWLPRDVVDPPLSKERREPVNAEAVGAGVVPPRWHFLKSWFRWRGLLALSLGALAATADPRVLQSVAEFSRLAHVAPPATEAMSRLPASGETPKEVDTGPRADPADQAASLSHGSGSGDTFGGLSGITYRHADGDGVGSNGVLKLADAESSDDLVAARSQAVVPLAMSTPQAAVTYAVQDSSRTSRIRLNAQERADSRPVTQPVQERTSPMTMATLDERGRLLAGLISQLPRDQSLSSRLWSSWRELLTIQITVQSVLLFSACALLWYGLSPALGAQVSRTAAPFERKTIVSIARATLCGILVIAILSFLFAVPAYTAVSFGAGSFLVIAGIDLGSVVVRKMLRRTRSPVANVRHFVIVGTNARAIGLARRIEADRALGYRLVGFVDKQWSGDVLFHQSGYKIVSDFAGFRDFIKDHVVDEVVICTPVKSLYDLSSRIFSQCEEQGLTIRYGSDLFNPTIGHSRFDRLGEEVLLTVDVGRQVGPGMLVKRLLDVTGSAALLVLFMPVLIAVAAAVKFTSPGPVMFTQERVGLNKRRFRMHKFRTMVVDAERRQTELENRNEISGPVFKIKQDPRVTSIGKFLRKSSLDELPQLVNVLKGDMSLVGPRPLAVRDYRGFTEDWHRRRLSVRPGITCLWQVLGRNSIPFERWMELDLEYIDKWSLGLDLKILLKTLPAVMRGSGAS